MPPRTVLSSPARALPPPPVSGQSADDWRQDRFSAPVGENPFRPLPSQLGMRKWLRLAETRDRSLLGTGRWTKARTCLQLRMCKPPVRIPRRRFPFFILRRSDVTRSSDGLGRAGSVRFSWLSMTILIARLRSKSQDPSESLARKILRHT